MCGIFGFSVKKDFKNSSEISQTFKELFLLSESRGKEASGMAINNGLDIKYVRSPYPASEMVASTVFKREMKIFLNDENLAYKSAFGHSRLVTNGYEHENKNNQPVVKNNIIAIHNGIIVNNEELWKKYSSERKETDLDSELIPTLVGDFLEEGLSIEEAISKLYANIYGMTTIAMYYHNRSLLSLATNNGSLYFIFSKKKNCFLFASERHILLSLLKKVKTENFIADDIQHLPANSMLNLDLSTLEIKISSFQDDSSKLIFFNKTQPEKAIKITEIIEKISNKAVITNRSMEHVVVTVDQTLLDKVKERRKRIELLKRCSKCVLPHTFPFISFDEQGVCSYCRSYKKMNIKSEQAFKELVQPYKKKGIDEPDCLLPFSGGRDSSYVMHYAVKELGLKPIAFSYDWGMLTDLARRNQARMCGALGVEHILVSADIRKKRKNIQKNVLAWLKRPNLGTIPLFMAGDKQYFYYANLLSKQNNLRLSILGENMLETTRFKTGFCGIKPKFDTEHTYSLSLQDKLKMLLFYGKEYLLNPAYLNSSLLDTLDAFKSYYVMEHNNVNMFDYVQWNETSIEDILINEYDWETDPGTSSTWRIGDGTTAFYNYIYYMVAGFTENDTFRSNQIREGGMDRAIAMDKITIENQPRWDSIQWYCNTIDIEFGKTIKRINTIPILF